MALHPDFSDFAHVFVVYNYNRSGTYSQKVVRYTYNNNTLSSPLILVDQIPAGNIHNGSRLVISSDLKLFISTGDAGNANSAQDLNSLAGKILELIWMEQSHLIIHLVITVFGAMDIVILRV